MTKRDLAASILGNELMRGFSNIGPGELRILAWHRICDDDPRHFPFDEGLISATPEFFRRQMQFVSRHFNVISFHDLDRALRDLQPLPPRALIITFDDGYRDNYTTAFPILREFRLPATIFLATGHIGQVKLFWWDQIAYLIKRTERETIHIPELSETPVSLAGLPARHRAIERILAWLKQAPDEVRTGLVDGLSSRLDVEMPAGLAEGMHMSWEEVKEMAARGIEFGSHSVTHPILARISEEQLTRELVESKREIEQRLGGEVVAFAYPAGRRSRINPAVCQAVARHGYRYAVAFDEGIITDLDKDRFTLPRIHVERDHSMSLFRANLRFPRLMFREAL